MYALGQDVIVLGASSMGALRAAELHPHGMVGVGRIFEAYLEGRLSADDEVALLHGPAELGFRPLTLPLVNIRATLDASPLDAGLRGLLLATATRLPFEERTPSSRSSSQYAAWRDPSSVGLKPYGRRRPGSPAAAAASAWPSRRATAQLTGVAVPPAPARNALAAVRRGE
ncbi:TfuA-like protein [Archangium violaceum]|uniref:TfuA-like protein n=1 Tax=Archangium violaceum TaxID=83451 RepID=UPI001EF1610A|nr:TfuA-like protein [Archangium violaceum]